MNNLYRNTEAFGHIEPGALWELKDDVLILVDEDEYLTLNFKQWSNYFEKE